MYVCTSIFLPLMSIGQIKVLPSTSVVVDTGTTISIHTAQQTLMVQSGAVVQNDGLIILGEESNISEAPGSPIFGSGTEEYSKTFIDPLTNEDLGGLGLILTTVAPLGQTTIIRGHSSFQNDLSESSVFRWFDLEIANSPISADIVFNYDETELNSIPEQFTELHGSLDGGNSWVGEISTPNTTLNHVSAFGLDTLGLFTLFQNSVNVDVANIDPRTQELSVTPNPNNGNATIYLPEVHGTQVLTIWNTKGDMVYREELAPNLSTTELKGLNLAPGLYMIRSFDGKRTYTAKMTTQ